MIGWVPQKWSFEISSENSVAGAILNMSPTQQLS